MIKKKHILMLKDVPLLEDDLTYKIWKPMMLEDDTVPTLKIPNKEEKSRASAIATAWTAWCCPAMIHGLVWLRMFDTA